MLAEGRLFACESGNNEDSVEYRLIEYVQYVRVDELVGCYAVVLLLLFVFVMLVCLRW